MYSYCASAYRFVLDWTCFRKIEENNNLFHVSLHANSAFVDTQDYDEASLQYLKIKMIIVFSLPLLDY